MLFDDWIPGKNRHPVIAALIFHEGTKRGTHAETLPKKLGLVDSAASFSLIVDLL